MTPKQQRFVEEYLIDLNARQAAIRAGYSENAAKEQGYENLTKPHIAEAIAEAMAARSERTKIDADWVLRRLVEIDRTNMADFLVIPEGGGMPCFDLSAATPEQLAAIEGLQLDTYREKGEDGGTVEKIKLTLPGKLKTLELIGKHVDVQAFAERHEHTGKAGGPVEISDMSTLERAMIIGKALRAAAEITAKIKEAKDQEAARAA